MAKRILLINGPNLNLLGLREPELYGSSTLPQIEAAAMEQAAASGAELQAVQSNHEGNIIDAIHNARQKIDAIVINPAAFTHTSVAIRDALLAVEIPFIEVHLTNVHARESWRHTSYLSDKAQAVIAGLGPFGYTVAIDYFIKGMNMKGKQPSKM